MLGDECAASDEAPQVLAVIVREHAGRDRFFASPGPAAERAAQGIFKVIEEPLISRTNRALCREHGAASVTETVVGVKTILVRWLREVNETVELAEIRPIRSAAQGTTVERTDALWRADGFGRRQWHLCFSVRWAQEPSRLHGRVHEHSQRKTDPR